MGFGTGGYAISAPQINYLPIKWHTRNDVRGTWYAVIRYV